MPGEGLKPLRFPKVGLLVACLFCCLSCATAYREHLFSGRAVTHTGSFSAASPDSALQGGDTLSVQGWVVRQRGARALSLTFSNQSDAVVPMSAVVDEYTVKTDDGRIIFLEEADFLSYPDKLAPGDERTVSLRLPQSLGVERISQVVARLDMGKVVVVLHALGPKEPAAWRVGSSTAIVVSERAKVVRIDPMQQAPASGVAVLQPVGPVAPRSEAPTGTVAVIVTFRQSLGSTLHAEVYWNESKERVTLASGDQQLFYVVPGQHEFHAVSRLPFIMETHGRVPVVVSATSPVRIELTADAHLSGAVLQVKVFNADRMIVNQRFAPLGKG